MFEPENYGSKPLESFATDDGWMEDRNVISDADLLPDNEAYDNAETFGEVLRQYKDTVSFVSILYPDQMDVDEAEEVFHEGLAGGENEETQERDWTAK